MTRPLFSRAAIGSVLATAVIVLAAGLPAVPAQDSEAPAKAAPAKPAPAEEAQEFKGRLPAYYGKVVDEKQRQAIYDIQEEYHPRIAALKAQLEALMKERDEKIEAVLTPEQLQKIEAAKAAAKAKRAAKKPAS